MYVILDLTDCFVVWVIAVWAVAVWMVACGFVCVRWLGLGVCFGLCCFGLRWLVFGLLLFVGVVYYLWWCWLLDVGLCLLFCLLSLAVFCCGYGMFGGFLWLLFGLALGLWIGGCLWCCFDFVVVV